MDANIFIKAALSKRVEIPPEKDDGKSKPSCSNLAKSQDPKTTRTKERIRSTAVENILVKEGMKRYGRDLNATVKFLVNHSDALDNDLKTYYDSVGKPHGVTMTKAVDRIRRLDQKPHMDSSSEIPEKTQAVNEFNSSSDETDTDSRRKRPKIEEKDTRFTGVLESTSRTEVMRALLKTPYDDDDTNDDGNDTEFDEDGEGKNGSSKKEGKKQKPRKNKGKQPKSRKKQMDEIMASLAELIKNANDCVKDHSLCLNKWMKQQNIDSD